MFFNDGYPQLVGSLNRVPFMVRGHRVAYALAVGAVPAGLGVLHSCDRPACVRPEHLRVGTAADNARDRVARGRSARGRKLSPEDRVLAALIVRSMRANGKPRARAQAEVAALFDCNPRTIGVVLTALAA